MDLLEVLEKHSISVEVREVRCADSFHKDYHPDETRDMLAFHFGPNSIMVLCLGCHLIRSEFPKGPPEAPWLKEKEDLEAEERMKGIMAKRVRRRKCALCNQEPQTQINGLKFCLACAERLGGTF
jgi:hypothetical protein